MVAVLTKHVHHVTLGPLVEETVIAAVTLGHIPFVKGFQHHHEAHLVAQLHQLGGRHVVTGADGIAAHVLEHGQLVADGVLIDGRPQRTEVMMQAHALELAQFAIEEEALVGHELHRAYAEDRLVLVHLAPVYIKAGGCSIEMGMLG